MGSQDRLRVLARTASSMVESVVPLSRSDLDPPPAVPATLYRRPVPGRAATPPGAERGILVRLRCPTGRNGRHAMSRFSTQRTTTFRPLAGTALRRPPVHKVH